MSRGRSSKRTSRTQRIDDVGRRNDDAKADVRILEEGTILEARFWLGGDDAKTGELIWVCGRIRGEKASFELDE